jgi:group I intron endonuclease
MRLKCYYNIYFLESAIKKRKSLIYSGLLKYGYSNFTLEILEYCDSSETIQREQYYLDLLKPEYNILLTAGSRLGSKHSEQTRAKISAAAIVTKTVQEVKDVNEQKEQEVLVYR